MWILIIILIGPSGNLSADHPAIDSIEFTNEATCMYAASKIEKVQLKGNLFCVPK